MRKAVRGVLIVAALVGPMAIPAAADPPNPPPGCETSLDKIGGNPAGADNPTGFAAVLEHCAHG